MRIGMARFLLLLSFPFVFLSFLICDYLFFLQLREGDVLPSQNRNIFLALILFLLSLLSLLSFFACARFFPLSLDIAPIFFKHHPCCKTWRVYQSHYAMWAGLRDGVLWRG